MGEAEGGFEGAGHSEWQVALAVVAFELGAWVAPPELTSSAGIELGAAVVEPSPEVLPERWTERRTERRTESSTDAVAEAVACSCQRCGRGSGRASVAMS